MTKRLFLFLILISVLLYSGCGGGGGKKTTPPLGAIQGTVTFDGSSSSLNVAAFNTQPVNFAKASLRQNLFSKQLVANEKIVKLRPGLSAQEATNVIASLGGTIKKKLYGTEATYLITVNDQTFSKSSASQSSAIEYIEENLKFQAFATPMDPYFIEPYNWNYNMLNLEDAWEIQKGETSTTDIIVAVLDTGISLTHPDFKDKSNLVANLVSGYDFVGLNDENPSDTEFNVDNPISHGTHVAGIISAFTDNETGIAGVAWNVKIMPIRVLGPDGLGTIGDIAEGINHAVKNGANIINLSLGITGPKPGDDGTETLMEAIDNAFAAKITVVAAAGNDGVSTVAFPANYDEKVIAVSALDHTGVKASYSNYGSEIDFCAPGGGVPTTATGSEWAIKTILSTCYDKKTQQNNYVFMAGTSMAAPHISGLAALLYAKNPNITPLEVEASLKTGCIDLGNSNYYGSGLPDAYAVLTDTPPKMSNVKVFIGNSNGEIVSNLQHVGASGDFTLSDLGAGNYYIYAFVDSDGDNTVDQGEKIGYRQVTLTRDTILTGVNIALPN